MDREYGRASSSILRMISSGEIEASTSGLVPIEVANSMRKYGLGEVPAEISAMFSLGMTVHEIGAADTQEAAEIFSKFRINPYDCLHAAVMKRLGINEIISADKEFERPDWMVRVDPKTVRAKASR